MHTDTFIGYHTTWKSIADELLGGTRQFRAGKYGWDWLGTGVYFWVGNQKMASYWGRKLARDDPDRAAHDVPVILKCSVTASRCLNMANTGHVLHVAEFLNALRSKGFVYEIENLPGLPGHPLEGEAVYRFLDHKIIDDFCSTIAPDTDVVLGVFINGTSIYPKSELKRFTSIQIAVREHAISNISIDGIVADGIKSLSKLKSTHVSHISREDGIITSTPSG